MCRRELDLTGREELSQASILRMKDVLIVRPVNEVVMLRTL